MPNPSESAPTRAQEAARRAELAAAHERGESAQAQRLIDAFIARITPLAIPTEPLQARLLSGPTVRTDKVGWYLRNDRSVAIGPHGEYYVLVVPGGWAERFRGVRLRPTPPPLIVAKGGRDGESGDMAFYLDKLFTRLTGGPAT